MRVYYNCSIVIKMGVGSDNHARVLDIDRSLVRSDL